MPVLRQIRRKETSASRRAVLFQIVGPDGKTPILTMAGEQPQVSIDLGGWIDAGISALTHIGSGRYYAILDEATCDAFPRQIETRFAADGTLEIPGDSVEIVPFKTGDEFKQGTIRGANTSTVLHVNDTGLSAAGDYVGATLVMLSGDMAGESAKISAYDPTGGAKTITLEKALSSGAVAIGDLFMIIGA